MSMGRCWTGMERCGRAQPRPWPALPWPGSGRCSARADATGERCPSHASLESRLRSYATRGESSRTRATIDTLWRADFDRSLAAGVLELFHDHDQPSVMFTDRGPEDLDFIITAFPTGREHFDDYVGQNREHAEINAAGTNGHAPAVAADPLFHICAIGTTSEMLDFEKRAHERFGGRIQTFVQRSQRYLGTMCELLRHDANKWTAILHLARLWGIEPGAICAVGDDANDIPMIKNAGLGVAMGHARPEVRAAADLITGDHDADGVAMLVEDVLLGDEIRG